MSIELSREIDKKIEELITVWADEYLIDKPMMFGSSVYYSIKGKLEEEREQEAAELAGNLMDRVTKNLNTAIEDHSDDSIGAVDCNDGFIRCGIVFNSVEAFSIVSDIV